MASSTRSSVGRPLAEANSCRRVSVSGLKCTSMPSVYESCPPLSNRVRDCPANATGVKYALGGTSLLNCGVMGGFRRESVNTWRPGRTWRSECLVRDHCWAKVRDGDDTSEWIGGACFSLPSNHWQTYEKLRTLGSITRRF